MESDTAVCALAALAHKTRLAVFRALVVAGPNGLAVGEIAQKLKLANATLSFHLKELAHAGLVRTRQQGRFIYCTANFDAMNGLLQYLTENCCAGSPCEVGAACATCQPQGACA